MFQKRNFARCPHHGLLSGTDAPACGVAIDFAQRAAAGGKFIFFEHGLSPDPRVQRWQRWSEPITYWVFEGCHVTRDIPSLITQSGFRIEQMETGYLAAFPKSWSYYWWGTAI